MGQGFIGTSGYNYRDWKGKFYPEKLPQKEWLSYYSQQFQTVEMNATFYGSFSEKTYGKWAEQTPEDFRFVIKGSRYITHIKRIKDVAAEIERQMASARRLGSKLRVMLWQFPASFRNDDERYERLELFLKLLPKDIGHAIELRHASWFTAEIFDLVGQYNATIVINETPAFAVTHQPNGRFVYIRFHGPSSLYASSYTDEQLQGWAEKINAWRREREIYAYFNNDVSGFAIQNAKMLISMIQS